ncbi:MAG: hypothetical protein L0L93_13900, partial [Brevibacterium sp.]|nr:hypothetical protein [Brevibacterium sp.]
ATEEIEEMLLSRRALQPERPRRIASSVAAASTDPDSRSVTHFEEASQVLSPACAYDHVNIALPQGGLAVGGDGFGPPDALPNQP